MTEPISLKSITTFEEMIQIECGIEYEISGNVYVNRSKDGKTVRLIKQTIGGFTSYGLDMEYNAPIANFDNIDIEKLKQ
jgi:hypothetical protein